MGRLKEIGIVNHLRNDCIWYHSTPAERAAKIMSEGLKINSPPTFQSVPEDRIYLSTNPFMEDEFVVLEVDLSLLEWKYAGWPFVDDNTPLEERWQLVVTKDIPNDWIKISSTCSFEKFKNKPKLS